MVTVKVILKKNKRKENGELPLYIRLTKNSKSSYKTLGIWLKENQWDGSQSRIKKHPNSARFNALVASQIAEIRDIAIEMEKKNKVVTAAQIMERTKGKTSTSFTQFFREYINRLQRDEKIGTLDKASAVFRKFKRYCKDKDVQFDEITVNYLGDYEDYLRAHLENSTNTIHSNLKIFRMLFNEAVRKDLVEYDKNPFLKYQLKTEKTDMEFLTEEELGRIEDLTLTKGNNLELYRNMFVFACYVGGLRISDMLQLKWKNFDGTHISVVMKKGKERISVKVPSKGKEIINIYAKGHGNEEENYLFPCLSHEVEYDPVSLAKKISSKTAIANKKLKEIAQLAAINKRIHFHTSRHTWATRALRKGMRIEYVSKLMGHASIKTTQKYAKIVDKELDQAMNVFG